MGSENLFVYGTLQPGGFYYPRIERFVRSWRRGRIGGVLVDAGWYPALIPGEGIVLGALLEVEPEALAVTDEIESCAPGSGDRLYIRRKAEVRLERPTGDEPATVMAWTYEHAEPVRMAHLPKLIVRHEKGMPVHAFQQVSK